MINSCDGSVFSILVDFDAVFLNGRIGFGPCSPMIFSKLYFIDYIFLRNCLLFFFETYYLRRSFTLPVTIDGDIDCISEELLDPIRSLLFMICIEDVELSSSFSEEKKTNLIKL